MSLCLAMLRFHCSGKKDIEAGWSVGTNWTNVFLCLTVRSMLTCWISPWDSASFPAWLTYISHLWKACLFLALSQPSNHRRWSASCPWLSLVTTLPRSISRNVRPSLPTTLMFCNTPTSPRMYLLRVLPFFVPWRAQKFYHLFILLLHLLLLLDVVLRLLKMLHPEMIQFFSLAFYILSSLPFVCQGE